MSDSRQFALSIVRRLREAGYEALWAGGCVRDALLGLIPKDYDVATSARPEEIRRVFGRNRTLALGAAFGVITVLGRKPIPPIEVATFRRDAKYSDGRRPDEVTFSSAEEDARRRDFTINGLFFDPVAERVIDYVGGREDLRQGVIRAIGDPHDRIAEDKLRMLRAVRIAAALDFRIEPRTREAVRRHADELSVVSAERIAAELRRMLVDRRRSVAAALLRDTDLLPTIVPDWNPSAADWETTLAILSRLDAPTFSVGLTSLLRAACLASSRTAPDAERRCRRLRLSNQETAGVRLLLDSEQTVRQAASLPWSRLQPVLISDRVDEILCYAQAVAGVIDGDVSNVDFCRRKLELPADQLDPPPLIGGDELIDAGLCPSPRFREILQRIRDEQLDGRLNSAEDALRLARRLDDDEELRNENW